jgi:hypothetical protein
MHVVDQTWYLVLRRLALREKFRDDLGDTRPHRIAHPDCLPTLGASAAPCDNTFPANNGETGNSPRHSDVFSSPWTRFVGR